MSERRGYDIMAFDDGYKHVANVTARSRKDAVVNYFSNNSEELEKGTHYMVIPDQAVKTYQPSFIQDEIEGSEDSEENSSEDEGQQKLLYKG